MNRRYSFIACVLALIITMLIIPESRRIVRFHLKCMSVRTLFAESMDRAYGVPLAFLSTWRNAPVSLDVGWKTDIAKQYLCPRNSVELRKQYYTQAIKAAPNQPEVWADYLTNFCTRQALASARYVWPIKPPSDGLRIPARVMDPAPLRTVLDVSKKGMKCDPDNAFFNLMGAYALFNLHRDSEAHDLIHLAAQKKHYNSYQTEVTDCVFEYLCAAGVPRLEAECESQMLTVNRPEVLSGIGYLVYPYVKKLDSGKHTGGVKPLLTDMARIGRLIRASSNSLDDEYVAQSVMGVAAAPIVARLRDQNTLPPRLTDEFVEKVSQTLNEQGLQDLAAIWAPAYRTKMEVTKRGEYFQFSIHDPRVHAQILECMVLSGQLLVEWAILFFAICLLGWPASRLVPRGSDSTQSLSRGCKSGLAAVGLIPCIVSIAFVSLEPVIAATAHMCDGPPKTVEVPPMNLWLSAGVFAASVLAVLFLTVQIILSVAKQQSGAGISNWRLRGILGVMVSVLPVLLLFLMLPLSIFRIRMEDLAYTVDSNTTLWYVLGTSLLRLALVGIVEARLISLRRRSACDNPSICLLDTLRQGTLFAGKFLLVMFFVVHFISLPLGSFVTEELRYEASNEVKMIMQTKIEPMPGY